MKKTISLAAFAAILVFVGVLVSPASSQATPTTFVSPIIKVIDLGTLGTPWNGGYSMAWGINDPGQVVGTSRTASGDLHAFLWMAKNGMTDLGALGNYGSVAFAVNNRGQVVGWSSTGYSHGFLWTPTGGMIDLGSLGGTIWDNTYARSINDRGEVVGNSTTASGERHAFIWTAKNGMIDLGTLGGNFSDALDINNRGQVVGLSTNAMGQYRIFLWTAKGKMTDLGIDITYDEWEGNPLAINDLGQIVGNSSPFHAFIWTPKGGMIDLGGLGSYGSVARDINDLGMVVGSSPTGTGERHAFLWTAKSGMTDLGTLGGTQDVSEAFAINNRLQIAGLSITSANEVHAVRWSIVPRLNCSACLP